MCICIVLINDKPKLIEKSSIQFIDAGDFDNDGKLEFLFKLDTGFLVTYILFYNEFKKSVKFEVFSN